ncbi:MAG TPA: O-antigen ligase family protein [Opitutaceae bacterium]|nr:O-antigen ligase family protein [Opitutaceae bacterium]
MRPLRPTSPKVGPVDPVGRFRSRSHKLELHPQERWTLFWVTLHLCFLPWALGTMHLWSQCTSLVLALLGFITAARPRLYSETQTSGESVRVRPLARLWRFPLFWLGLAVLLYIAIQALNPAWRYRSNAAYWWIDPVKNVAWLPSGMDVPFSIAGPWRALLIQSSLWLTVCTVWIGVMRRLSFRLLFTVLVANGVALAALGLAQQLTHAKAIFWLVPSSSASFVASFIYRNHAGAYLNLVLALAAGLAWWHFARSNRRLEKSSPAGVFTFGALILGVMVLFTLSRGSAITLLAFTVVTGLAFFWHQFRRPAHERNGLVLLGLCLLLAGFLAVGFYSLKADKVWARFEGLLVDPVASARDRTQAHAATLDMFNDKPVLGWGAGCFRFGFPQYVSRYPDIYYSGTSRRKLWEHAHNDLLEFPAEFGLAGCVLLVGAAGWLGWQLLRRRFWGNPLSLPVALGAGLTVVHAWGDFVFQNPAVLFTWAVLLLAAGRWADLDQQPALREGAER